VKSYYSTFIRLLFCLVSAVLWSACQTNVAVIKEAEKVSTIVGNQFVPDSREDIYQVHFRESGSALIITGETTCPEARLALLSQLSKTSKSIIDSIRLLPDSSLGAKTWGLVNISVCNLRTNPGHGAEMATQAILGTPVRILKRAGGWLLIQTPDHYIGWVDDDALVLRDSVGMAAWRGDKRIIYLPLMGAAFSPDTREPVTDLVAGSILKLAEVTKNGDILEMPDGRRLIIPVGDGMDFESWKNSATPSPSALSSCAKTLMGRPYLWGGTSAKGIDCSGFVKTVYFLNGIILARDASLQFRHGVFTEPQSGYEKLKEGDLIFFGRKADNESQAKATHVGFYLGNGEYIHSSGFVKINSFNPAHTNYSKTRADAWLGGRTILGSEGSKGIVRVKDHPWY
jgi:hypothetical protein